MKVLYFHQHFTTPAIGGATRSYEFARRLIEKGHTVSVVCGEFAKLNLPETDTKGIYRGDIDGIDVIQIALPYSNSDSIAARAWIFLKFGILGIKVAMKEEYDILFATSTPLTAGIPGIFMKLFGKKKKFVFEVRDLWPELPKALGMKNPFLLWGMSVLEKISYSKADACIGLSPGICEGIVKRSQKNKQITLIPNGCDLDLFVPGNRAELVLEGIKPTDTVAIFTGAHGIANGLHAVLDAAEVLKQKGRLDIVLAFIGDGKMKPELAARAVNENLSNCRFYDPMPKSKLNKIVANSDIGMMVLADVPAFYYGTSPNKFFDYISSGLPVLNNYPGWLADIIQENNCGLVVPPNNAEAFANALIKLADDRKLADAFGENSRRLAESEFSRNDLADKFVDFLEEIQRKK
ncbi:glycosyltransferase family 4 protein [Flavobacterium frigoris]|jgi:glycosyltransferase involved in cell wall biosynthesis|uniref:Glycosyltransferase n=1 Tax=Flavobacterium frigoris (strain PS1) TaxID=1086011 RepID=H7FMM0_FLAFP|nr:glycosyltransferase family 4 protein [Flavobacterium frigoris]EIA10232.1 glycosyltransferase [Flavobacterium frigoris PS1]